MRILSNPGISLGCAILNACFSASSFWQGSITWGVVCAIFAGFCFNNYLKAR
jgi:hypothetical protein